MIEKNLPKKTQVEDSSLKKTDISSSVPTIDLTNSEEEEGRSSPVLVSIETSIDSQDLTNGNNGNVLSPLPQSQPLCQSAPSSSTILLFSIMVLSSFSDSSILTPFMTELYRNVTIMPLFYLSQLQLFPHLLRLQFSKSLCIFLQLA